MESPISKYSKFLSNHPWMILIISAALCIIMAIGMAQLQNKSVEYEDMLPQNYEVIKSFKMISEDFGGTTSGRVLIYIDNTYANSSEVKSVCDTRVVTYSKKLEDYLSTVTDVSNVNGIGNMVYDYYGKIPGYIKDIRVVSQASGAKGVISQDESMAVITLTFNDNVDSEEVTKEVQEVINTLDKPAGIKVSLVGDVFAQSVVMQEIGPSMTVTSNFAMIAIIVILFLVFKNLKGVVMPLMAIIFGVFWTMGFMGLIGKGLSTMTSGTISMIMGVGIDFGIQIMSRFNYELKRSKKRKAMEETLKGTLFPIFTTALACLIGFKAMGLGELTMMAEIGDVMGYGVVFCMLAAITIVPSLLVLITKDKPRNKKGEIIEEGKKSGLKKFIGINYMITNQTGFAGIVVDMQTYFLKDFQPIKREEMILEQLKTIGKLQSYGIPMFLLEYKDHGETEERIRDAICYLGKIEPIIKEKESGFSNKHLEEILNKLNVRNIILMGVNASACVMETAKEAKQRKYQVISAETTIGDSHKIDCELQIVVKNLDGSVIKESLDWYKYQTFLFANSGRLCNYVKENISK